MLLYCIYVRTVWSSFHKHKGPVSSNVFQKSGRIPLIDILDTVALLCTHILSSAPSAPQLNSSLRSWTKTAGFKWMPECCFFFSLLGFKTAPRNRIWVSMRRQNVALIHSASPQRSGVIAEVKPNETGPIVCTVAPGLKLRIMLPCKSDFPQHVSCKSLHKNFLNQLWSIAECNTEQKRPAIYIPRLVILKRRLILKKTRVSCQTVPLVFPQSALF